MSAVPEDVALDLADALRRLAETERIVSLASVMVSHGDAAGFDASLFEDCSPGFQRDFHALRRACAARPSVPPVPDAPDDLLARFEAFVRDGGKEVASPYDPGSTIVIDWPSTEEAVKAFRAAERQRLRAETEASR